MGYQSFPNPPKQQTIIPPTKRSKLCYYSQIPPIDAYIMATEQASSRLPTQEADEFRSDVNRLLKQQQQQHNNHCNLNPAQCRALTQLKQDNTRVVLTVDKGWPWSSWTNRTTTTKHKHFYKTPTPTKFSTRILPPNSKTSSSPYSKISSLPCWSSALPTPTSSSRVNITNRYKVHLWDPPSAPS